MSPESVPRICPQRSFSKLQRYVYSRFVRILLFAFLASTLILGQSLDELKGKYGAAISETFIVRSGMGVRVRNGPNGRVAEMLIFPMRADSLIESRSMTFSYETAKNLLNELLPASRRGKFVIGGFVDAFCMPENDCAGSSEDYKNVTVYYNSSAKPGQLCYVDVRFKK